MTATAFPLEWPAGWPRSFVRDRARYSVSFTKARDEIMRELRLMGCPDWNVVISSNAELRLDGLPLARARLGGLPDPGVAVYFRRSDEPMVIACDVWDRVKDNLRACGLAITAMRQIDRCGASEILNRVFSGFKALPAKGETTGSPGWRDVLGCTAGEQLPGARRRYRSLAARNHPDRGGDAGAMAVINRAWEQAQQELG